MNHTNSPDSPFTIYKRISSISPQSHNKIPQASRNNYYTYKSHTSYLTLSPTSIPSKFSTKQKKSSKILHSIRQGWWRWDTHGAHTIVIHLPTGKPTPQTTEPAFVVDRRRATTLGLCWKVGSFYLGQCVKSGKPVMFFFFMICFVYRHHINLLRVVVIMIITIITITVR